MSLLVVTKNISYKLILISLSRINEIKQKYTKTKDYFHKKALKKSKLHIKNNITYIFNILKF